MGIYFNPVNESFIDDVNSRIYVDKTGLLRELNKCVNTTDRYIAVSHARRFGKTHAAGMIDAYYGVGCDSKEVFLPYEIAQSDDFEKHLNKYNVIHLDISSFADFYTDNLVKKIINIIYDELKEVYPTIMDIDNPMGTILAQVYNLSKRRFVIIIDEWDCVIRNFSHKPELVQEYLHFLHSLFKSDESKRFLALGYITGILPIKKIQDESALNNFIEYTMLESDELTQYFGFTEDEVRKLCLEYGVDFNTVKQWYNGYLIDGLHMYNPNSVYQVMIKKKYKSYWKNTSAFETINQYINLNYDGLKESILSMLSGEQIPVNVDTFTNDLSCVGSKDEALTALIHLGYLGYNAERKMTYIPNFEVSLAYQAALSTGEWKDVAEIIAKCDELLWATIDGNEERVAELIDMAHSAYSSVIQYNNENALSCVLTMAYFTAPAHYMVFRELQSGVGYADMVFIPRIENGNYPAMIIELKWDKDADTAIKQIKDRRYTGKLAEYYNKIILVGINYDKNDKNKRHNCIIEEWKN